MAEREWTDSGRTEVHNGDAEGGRALVAGDSGAGEAPRILRGEEFSEAVMRSLILAAKDAHLLAYRTGTGVVTRRNGKVAVVAPDPAMYEDLLPPPFQESPQA
jgi:hypothetical protein